MQYVNSIPLKDIITVYTPSGTVDIYGNYTTYTKSELNAAVRELTSHSRDNYQQETKYTFRIILKDNINKNVKVLIGTTTETDYTKVASKEIRDYLPMKTVHQTVIGYKIWL